MQQQKSVMKKDFATVPTLKNQRSMFDRSHGYKTTMDVGNLVPFYVDDVLPGDTFTMSTYALARLATPLFPMMDNMRLSTHFFFVPMRLVWDNARKFFGEQIDPADSIDYTIPVMTAHTPAIGSLSDYLGLRGAVGTETIEHNSLYHRGYNLIWNEWFRDQNLQDSLVVDTDDGPDNIADYVLKKRGKRHDYFTSCLPSPQKGDAVSLPLGTTAPVQSDGTYPVFNQGTDNINMSMASGTGTVNWWGTPTASARIYPGSTTDITATGLETDLSAATAATVNDLREAFQVQRLLERDMRGGTRYSELVNNHFGVNFYDVSYRPEFLGGGVTTLDMKQVESTGWVGNSSEPDPIGSLGAVGTFSVSDHGFTKSFVEHGFVLGLISVQGDLTYQQGIQRHFLKQTRYDIFWPTLAGLGEQTVTNAEIYYQNTSDDDLAFGYQERYAEYRYKPSMVTGHFRSNASAPLDAWHLSEEFSSLPTLGDTFIQDNTPVYRVIATPAEPHFIVDIYNELKCARAMPVIGIPGKIDHF